MTAFLLPSPFSPTTAYPRPRFCPPRAQIISVSDHQLQSLAESGRTIVLKCFASYCASCRGVAPKFRKIAAAYEQEGSLVSFCEIDYERYEQYCKDHLGVQSLPFFAIWTHGHYRGGEAMGWQSVGNKLVDRIESALDSHPKLLTSDSSS